MAAGWAQLAQRIGLGGVPDAHEARQRMQDEPIRAGVAGLFATRVAQEAFLPQASTDVDTQLGADAARASLAGAVQRVAKAAGYMDDTVSIAYETAKLASEARAIRPRLAAQAIAGWAIFSAVADVACGSDPVRAAAAFDEWDAASAVGDLARRSGGSDAQAWRAVELSRALLALPADELRTAAEADTLPAHWFENGAVRAATGWNEWDGSWYINREAWDEFIDALSGRDSLLGATVVPDAAARLKRRAATVGYELVARPDMPEDAATEG